MSSGCRPKSSSLRARRRPATIAIQTNEIGMSHFQPKAMNWSYRSLGKVPRSQMKMKTKIRTLARNQRIGHQPVLK